MPPRNDRFLDSSDEEEEDEETRLQRQEEEEQERLLSEQFGEAKEVSDPKKRKTEDIEAEYASTTRKKARKRPTLTPAMLTSAKGLVRIHSEFPRHIKWSTTKHKNNKTAAAAVYSRTLVNSYKSFCYDLFPMLNFQDVLMRIESFGSKKEIKDYLQHLREQVRNGHLEKVYGKEKAASIIAELEDGLKQQQQQDEFGDSGNMMVNMEGMVPEQAPTREYELRRGPFRGSSVEETSGDGGEETAVAASTFTTVNVATTAEPSNTATATTASDKGVVQDDLQDSDDELEFVISTKPKPANPFADDDDDDDDEEVATRTKVVATLEDKQNATEETQEKDEEALEMNIEKTNENETVVAIDGASAKDKETTVNVSGSAADDDGTLDEGAKEPPENENHQEGTVVMEEEAVSQEEEETQLASTASQDTQEPEDVVEESAVEQEAVSNPSQEHEPPSSSDETATVVPTMSESQLDHVSTQDLLTADSQCPSTEPLPHQEEATQSSSSDETVTVIPTMSTQTLSPGTGDNEDDDGKVAESSGEAASIEMNVSKKD